MLQVNEVVKKYTNQLAVDHVSFNVEKGQIFGLLGPNGAGKSSLLRMVTGITMPDSGSILFNNQPFNANVHNELIGYMPEERGLYKKMKVIEQVEYLGLLKGLNKKQVNDGINYWFEKLQIKSWANKKVEDLSKGMGQKLQFIITVLHKPHLLILDEPFSGLDPVNAEVIKQEIFLLAEQGSTIIFSTHRMEQVEEICNKIVLINKGKNILEGGVNEVKEKYKQNRFSIKLTEPNLPDSNMYSVVSKTNTEYVLQVNEGVTSTQLLQHCLLNNCNINAYNEVLPSLNEIFIQLVDGKATTQFENK